MAQQIKKKFIEDNAIDETKILLGEQGALRGKNSLDQTVNIIYLNADDEVEILGDLAATDVMLGEDNGIQLESSTVAATPITVTARKVRVTGTQDNDIQLQDPSDPELLLPVGWRYEITNYMTDATLTLKDHLGSTINTIPWGHKAEVILTGLGPATYVVNYHSMRAAGGYNVTNRRVVNMLDGVDPQDAVTKSQLDAAAGAPDAIDVVYYNASSGLTASDVQAAIDELDGRLDTAESSITTNATSISDHLANIVDAHDASAIYFNNASSGLTVDNVQAAIDELDGRLDTIEGLSVAQSGDYVQDVFVLTGTDITNQYVDLSFESVPLSIQGFVDRLAIHATGASPDITVSATGGAGGVTRIEFAGSLATGQAEELVEGDVLRFTYVKA